MKRWGWLYAMLGFLTKVVPARRLVQHSEPKPVQPREAITVKPKGNCKLTREDVLRMIEENGGQYSLDFSNHDFSELDLSIEAVVRELERGQHSLPEGEDVPFWVSKLTGGMRLIKASFRDATFRRTNLKGANFWRSDLRGANLRGANLEDVSFFEADLRGVSLYLARLQNTRLTAEQLGVSIWEEKEGRLQEARDTYRALKNNFNGIGCYRDASWSYVKERQMEKKTHWPPGQARACYAEELEGIAARGARRLWQLFRFYLKHLCSYCVNCVVELTCGYGEKPLRTLWWVLALVLVFPVFYYLSDGIASTDGASLTWLDYLNYSFGAFTTIGFARFITANWVAETLTSLEALLGISALALLMFALGNRISRS